MAEFPVVLEVKGRANHAVKPDPTFTISGHIDHLQFAKLPFHKPEIAEMFQEAVTSKRDVKSGYDVTPEFFVEFTKEENTKCTPWATVCVVKDFHRMELNIHFLKNNWTLLNCSVCGDPNRAMVVEKWVKMAP